VVGAALEFILGLALLSVFAGPAQAANAISGNEHPLTNAYQLLMNDLVSYYKDSISTNPRPFGIGDVPVL